MIRSWMAITFGLIGMAAYFWFFPTIVDWAYPPCVAPEGMVCHNADIWAPIFIGAFLIPFVTAAIGLLGLLRRGPLGSRVHAR